MVRRVAHGRKEKRAKTLNQSGPLSGLQAKPQHSALAHAQSRGTDAVTPRKLKREYLPTPIHGHMNPELTITVFDEIHFELNTLITVFTTN